MTYLPSFPSLKHGALVHGTSRTYLSYSLYFLPGLNQEYEQSSPSRAQLWTINNATRQQSGDPSYRAPDIFRLTLRRRSKSHVLTRPASGLPVSRFPFHTPETQPHCGKLQGNIPATRHISISAVAPLAFLGAAVRLYGPPHRRLRLTG